MKFICNICNTQMVSKTRGPNLKYICPKCGNCMVTYDYSKEKTINFDKTIYSVFSNNNIINHEVLNAISTCSAKNYIISKKIVEDNGLIFTGIAKDIINKLKILQDANVNILIDPSFPYKY